jgi:hypothetical protein
VIDKHLQQMMAFIILTTIQDIQQGFGKSSVQLPLLLPVVLPAIKLIIVVIIGLVICTLKTITIIQSYTTSPRSIARVGEPFIALLMWLLRISINELSPSFCLHAHCFYAGCFCAVAINSCSFIFLE